MRTNNTPKIFIIILGVVALLIVGIMSLHKSGNVQIYLAPSVAKLTLDGKQAKPGLTKVSPGKHTLNATMDGFKPGSKDFTVASSGTTKVYLVLRPSSSVGEQWYKDHPSDDALYQSVGQSEAIQSSQNQVATVPLVNDLPYIERYFRVDYGKSKQRPDDPNAVAIYVTTYGQPGVQQALDWIRSKGYDPNALEIIYTDGLTNP